MAEDTFIREVDEQMRQDRAHELWAKYGRLIIAAAVLVVLATAAFTGWEYYSKNQCRGGFGDQYLEAIDLSNAGKHDEAMADAGKYRQQGTRPVSRFGANADCIGKWPLRETRQGALATFTAIASDAAFSTRSFSDIARLRAGLLAVDLEDFAQVEARLASLAIAGGAFRHSAREALGIAALKAGDDQKALEWFRRLSNDANAATGVRTRAQLMLNLLAGKGVKADG